ncbi:aerobic cobaltochelatase subunit CobS [bacterium BMS3Bbin13]|nr:aerobic cobaltochelatase subunit CobS [bacterium BMS3Bbin13]
MEKFFSIAETFALPGVPKGVKIKGYDAPSEFTPPADPNYRFRRAALSDFLAWLKEGRGESLYISGPTGCGKSSLVSQVAAKLNLPLQRVSAHSRLEFPELVGSHTIVNGSMRFCHGPLARAMKVGHLFLLDEFDLLDPGTAAGLNGVLEGAPLVIPENGGEVIQPHPEFRFVATGNTAGNGDESGMYQGTVRQNLALMDRGWILRFTYPEPSEEEEILAKAVPDLPRLVRSRMVEIANEVRNLFVGSDENPGSIEVTLSTRSLIRWGRLAWFYRALASSGVNPFLHGLDRAVAFRAEPTTRKALHELVQRHFGDDNFGKGDGAT